MYQESLASPIGASGVLIFLPYCDILIVLVEEIHAYVAIRYKRTYFFHRAWTKCRCIIFFTHMTTTDLLRQNILEALGLQALPEQQKVELLGKMTEVLQAKIMDRLLISLSAEQQKHLDALLASKPKEEAVEQYLRNTLPNYDALVLQEIADFKEQMVHDAATVRSMLT